MSDADRELKRVAVTYGKDSEQAKRAAIEFCRRNGIDPFFKTATYPKVSKNLPIDEAPTMVSLTYFEEWQAVLNSALEQ